MDKPIEDTGLIVTADGIVNCNQIPVLINLSGSIQDAELAEAIIEAYGRYGPRLAELINNL